jgi:hypothetical protein
MITKADPTHPDYKRGYDDCTKSVAAIKAALDPHEAVLDHEARARAITNPMCGLGWLAAEARNYALLSTARRAVKS